MFHRATAFSSLWDFRRISPVYKNAWSRISPTQILSFSKTFLKTVMTFKTYIATEMYKRKNAHFM